MRRLGSVGRCLLLCAAALGSAGCHGLEHRLVFKPGVVSELGPDRVELPGAAGRLWVAHSVYFPTADGTRIHGWWCPGTDPSAGAILYCHGNEGSVADRAEPVARVLDELGLSVLVFDYPGYGRSGGRPTEAGCYAAADAAYDWLCRVQGVPPEKVVVAGISLGGGVAVDLASRRPARALVLVKTFTSVPDVASHLLLGLPVGRLMHNRFESLLKIPHCRMPVFIAAGEKDRLTPFAQGQRLFAAVASPAEFCALAGSDHDDPLTDEFFSRLRAFLRDQAPVGGPVNRRRG